MARGGKRPGAGRPKGATNKRSSVASAKVIASGDTPLDILLDCARRLHKKKDYANAALAAARAAPYVHQKFVALSEPAARHEAQKLQRDLFDEIAPAPAPSAPNAPDDFDRILN